MQIALHHRPTEREQLKARLLTGASILMLAPRRIGKSWLLEKLDEDMTQAGWLCVRIDVEGISSEEGFLRTLCREIEAKHDLSKRMLAHLKQRFKQISLDVGTNGLIEAVGKIDHRDFVETLVESLNQNPKRTLILIDEIALFVLARARQDPEGTKSLLYHLRKLQQGFPNVTWFLTGSVGLDAVARRHNMLGALLGYDTFPLEPFSHAEARSYIETLVLQNARSPQFDFADGAFEFLARELGWLSPYYLRQIVLLIHPTGKSEAEPGRALATIDDVDKAMRKLLSPAFRTHFASWEEHFVKNFDPIDSEGLKAILNIASETADGAIEATFLSRLNPQDVSFSTRRLKDLLSCLAVDGYLVKVDERWKFQSGLLRRYWLEYIAE